MILKHCTCFRECDFARPIFFEFGPVGLEQFLGSKLGVFAPVQTEKRANHVRATVGMSPSPYTEHTV